MVNFRQQLQETSEHLKLDVHNYKIAELFDEIDLNFSIRSGVVLCARKTLARSAFHAFQIGFKRCKSLYIL